VKNAAPDGTTALVTPAGMMFMYPHIYEKLSYDPFKDFVAVSTVATTGFGFAVGPAVPTSVTNLAQFVEWCKANPKQANYGSPASGSMPHLMIEAWKRRIDLDLVHTGYRGAGPAVLDLVGGQIAAVTSGLGDFLPHLQSGKVRVLATGGTRRTKYTPNVPTFIEQGVKDFVFQEDYAVFMPARTPAEHVNRMAADIKAALQKPAVQEMLDKFGLEPRATTPTELGQIVKTEYDRFGPIVKTIGFKAD
jgi:tripartite-type tricarboxylate transporter receptor subunit TctC